MSYRLGEFTKRNNSDMFYTTINTTAAVKEIEIGAEFEIFAIRNAGNGEVYGVKSVDTALKYYVSKSDMTDFFRKIDTLTPVVGLSSEKTTTPELRPCICDSIDLFRYGCRCGSVKNDLDKRYDEAIIGTFGKDSKHV